MDYKITKTQIFSLLLEKTPRVEVKYLMYRAKDEFTKKYTYL